MDIKDQKCQQKISKISQQNHIIEEIGDNGQPQYNCTACGKIFRSRSQKYYHINCTQLLQMIYKCNDCDKAFARLSQLKYHSQSHISPVNKCNKCQKSFSNPLALKKHVGLHNVKPKMCPHCDKSFLKKESLNQHIAAQHLNQLQYGCASCSKKYSSKSSLQLHLQTHEKKRFECSYCGKLFYRNSILNSHLKRHCSSSGYMCAVCHKAFSDPGALARHNKIHEENVIQYYCKLCSKSILRRDNMNRHLNTIHPEEKFDNIVEIIRPLPSQTNNIMKTEIETNKNKSFVIIENKLIQQQQIHTEINIDLPKEKNQQSDFQIFPAKNNQIKVITAVSSYESKYLTDENEIQSVSHTFLAADKFLNKNEIQSNLENHISTINQDEIQTDCQPKPQTISSVIRSIGNVNKNLPSNNVINSNSSIDNKTNLEYKHKKYCRNNYNIDLYRKILGCDEEEEEENNQQQENNNRDTQSDPLSNNVDNNALKSSAPIHWRKSFKTSYETSASNYG